MEVAVTLSLGGNQAADTSGGAEQKMMPGKVHQLVSTCSRRKLCPTKIIICLRRRRSARKEGVMHSAWLFCIALIREGFNNPSHGNFPLRGEGGGVPCALLHSGSL